MKTTMKYIDSLSGREFEKYIYKLFNTNPRYTAKLTPASHDFGLDVIATDKYHPEYHHFMRIKTSHGYLPSNDKMLTYYKRTYGIQCKHTNGTAIGYKAVEESISGIKYYKIPKAIVLTNGLFTPHAKAGAKRTGVILFNRDSLKRLISQYYHDIEKYMLSMSGNEKDLLKLSTDTLLGIRAFAKAFEYNDMELAIDSMMEYYYRNELTQKEKIKILSIYNKLRISKSRLLTK